MATSTTGRPSIRDIGAWHWAAVAAILAITAGALLWAGRSPICACGTVELFHGALDSGNSQHISDWYTPSHIIHGFLFYALGWLILRSRPPGERLILAVAIEAAWEVLENSPIIIDRYRGRRSRSVIPATASSTRSPTSPRWRSASHSRGVRPSG